MFVYSYHGSEGYIVMCVLLYLGYIVMCVYIILLYLIVYQHWWVSHMKVILDSPSLRPATLSVSVRHLRNPTSSRSWWTAFTTHSNSTQVSTYIYLYHYVGKYISHHYVTLIFRGSVIYKFQIISENETSRNFKTAKFQNSYSPKLRPAKISVLYSIYSWLFHVFSISMRFSSFTLLFLLPHMISLCRCVSTTSALTEK